MTRRYQDKIVLITGAGSGFGRLAAQRFHEEGAKLSISDRNEAGLAETVTRLEAMGADVISQSVDVSREADVAAQVSATVARFGGLDVALNNAGVGGGRTPIQDVDVETFDQVMGVNARGVFLGMKHQIPAMLDSGGGAILNVASAAGLVGARFSSAYAASKHAVIGLTRTAADELGMKGIRVNAICPSFATTPMVSEMAQITAEKRNISVEDFYDALSTRVPMRRVASPDEVVQAMLWICSPENSFMTGQAVSIDGGLTAI